MKRALLAAIATVVLALPATQAAAQTADRLYIMDCGHNAATDQARWSPGVNAGKPLELSDNCYLIQHGSQLLLWDTGYPDSVADKPLTSPIGTATRSKRLADQLTALKLSPADITWVAVSHTHGDHVGNVDMFPQTPLLIQKAELDWAFADGKPAPFNKDRPIKELSGDFDVFGDGSAVILATPGHTPGHQSLLVHLPKTGYVVLTGDLAHFTDNWDNDRVPSMNTSADQTHASRAKVMKVLADKKAQLWINHDQPTSAGQKHSPDFYD
jgi:N-acyl homoserine lactone hydrolase